MNEHVQQPISSGESQERPRRRLRVRWPLLAMIVFIMLASLAFVHWSLTESFRHGRLASEPNYDDVTYLYAGARVLHCDMIFVQDPSLREVNPNFPGERLQARITQEVLSNPDFELAKEIVVGENKRVYVLQNRGTLLPKRMGVSAKGDGMPRLGKLMPSPSKTAQLSANNRVTIIDLADQRHRLREES